MLLTAVVHFMNCVVHFFIPFMLAGVVYFLQKDISFMCSDKSVIHWALGLIVLVNIRLIKEHTSKSNHSVNNTVNNKICRSFGFFFISFFLSLLCFWYIIHIDLTDLDVTSMGTSMPSFRLSDAIFLCCSFSKFCRCVTYSLCE